MTSHALLSINRQHIVDNFINLDHLSKGETAAVVKANAYGTGAQQIIPALVDVGVEDFFVAQPSEYAQVASLLPQNGRVYVLNGASLLDGDMLADKKMVPVVNNHRDLLALSSHQGPVAYHLDTAMKRLGFLSKDWHMIPKNPHMVMSHLSCADEDDLVTQKQIVQFQEVVENMAPERASLANSEGIIHHPTSHYDLTRPGIGLYGGVAFDGVKPVMTLSAKILQKNNLNKDDHVGYGATFTAEGPLAAYVLGIGYADGLPRHLSNQSYKTSQGLELSFLGRISMDSCVVGVHNATFEEGQWIDLIYSPEDLAILAKVAGTISYELLTGLGSQFRGQRCL